MSETLRLKTEVEGLSLELSGSRGFQPTRLRILFQGEEIFGHALDRYQYEGQAPSTPEEEKLRTIFQKKSDPNWNFFDRVIALVDKHSKKKVLPTV